MEIRVDSQIVWRRQLFRDGVPWYYKGVVHEYPCCDEPFTAENLQGEYHIQGRKLGARSKDPQKYAKDAAVLLAYVSAHPDDEAAVFYLAQSYYDGGDFENARDWYARHLEKEPALVAATKWIAGEKLEREAFHPQVQRALDHAVKPLTRYRCAACGFEAKVHFWQCPGCQAWDSYPARRVEEL
jgi:lipopolysaccharide biosynthesis regulator YciM